jgi:hypothetical protein
MSFRMQNNLKPSIQLFEEFGIQMLQNHHLSPNEGHPDNLRNLHIFKSSSSGRWAAGIFQKVEPAGYQLCGRSLVSRVIV